MRKREEGKRKRLKRKEGAKEEEMKKEGGGWKERQRGREDGETEKIEGGGSHGI